MHDSKQLKTAIIVNFVIIDSPDITEITALSQDLGYDVRETYVIQPHNKKFLGKGQIQNIEQVRTKHEAQYVIYNGFLSGLQLKKMNEEIKGTILSRIDIIIATFESRAHTPESKLQIQLAHLLHSKAKLVRLWSHLERQRGGSKTIGGPGEKQLELDKRMISQSIERIKIKLAKIQQDRQVRSHSRQDPIISLVGFANAGKTTLFNALTDHNSTVSSKAFQTLDSLLRTSILPNQQKIVISDTVGFVSHLPPFLVKAFKATLDHIKQSSVIICVHDATNIQQADQIMQWLKILKVDHKPIIQVLNKIDLLEESKTAHDENEQSTHQFSEIFQDAIKISAQSGFNILALQERIIYHLQAHKTVTATLPYDQQGATSWLIKHSFKHTISYFEENMKITAKLSPANASKFQKLFPEIDFTTQQN